MTEQLSRDNMIKNPDELLKIMTAAAMGDKCFEHIVDYIKPGMTEKQVAVEIERVLFALGAEALAFDTICVSGINSNQPHGVPSDKVIMEGELLTMDFGAVYRGYCGDMTRTIGVGYLNDEQKQVYDVVLKAQIAGLKACRAGVLCRDVDKASRNVIETAGFGEYFIHTTGHGVGTRVHEAPRLAKDNDDVLAVNMAVTVEPGIYIPGKYGVRIEDLAIITEFGIINAVNSEKKLIII